MSRAFGQVDTIVVEEFTVTRTPWQHPRPEGGSYSTKAYQFQL